MTTEVERANPPLSVWLVIEPAGDVYVGHSGGTKDSAMVLAEECDLIAEYLPASRSLAAEAEVATYERAIAQFDEWLGGQAEFFKQNPQVNRTFLDCAARLMKTLRTVRHVAPPSPPVAPEPAQETWSQPELDEVEREATAMHAALGNAVPAQENLEPCSACGGDGYYKGPRLGDEPCPSCGGSGNQFKASSSEAAGDGVTHETARGWAEWIDEKCTGPRVTLLRYIDQQEQAEREAAERRLHLDNLRRNHTAVVTDWRLANEALAIDRDAERAQKEALQVELKEAKGLMAEAHDMLRRHVEHAQFQEAEVAALRAERDELKAKLEEANACPFDDCDQRVEVRYCKGHYEAELRIARRPLLDELGKVASVLVNLGLPPAGVEDTAAKVSLLATKLAAAIQQPAPAAPVAKEEATAEPCAECGQAITDWINRYSLAWPHAAGLSFCRKGCARSWADKHPPEPEPAPQPPATAGGAERRFLTEAAEALLRIRQNDNGDDTNLDLVRATLTTLIDAVEALGNHAAQELERRQP
jgi:hypothetical protein